MPLLKISSDKVFVGGGALSQLDNILPKYKNILLFNDKDGFHPCGAADYFNQKFNQKLLQGVQGDGFLEKSPPGRAQYVSYAGKALPIEDVEEKYREVKDNPGVDLIIAVGGGTIIDIAKIISIAYSNGCKKVEEILSDRTLGNRLDLIFIPTTAGTGSEATSFAVVYQDKVKISIDHKSLLPTYVVLDPRLLRSLPIPILNSTVLDALAQAIESIWARGGTKESREYSKEAIGLILDNLDQENTIERLSGLQVASHLAGKAINISKTTLPHSISYPLTSHFGVPHGVAVFLTLPKVAELNYYAVEGTVQPGVQIADIEKSFSILFSLFGVDRIERLRDKLMDVMKKLGFSASLRDYGIRREALSFLADNALTKGRSDNNPRKVDRDEVLRLLEEIY
ncbi:MAG: phosphonoacetaldehyde reductase [Candidatus Aminicenantes bacterium]|jgi:alcohol dehydrogenase class IV